MPLSLWQGIGALQEIPGVTPNPAGGLIQQGGRPDGWLGYDKYKAIPEPDEWEVKTANWPLRGIKTVEFAKLERALTLTVEKLDDGQFLVHGPDEKVGYYTYPPGTKLFDDVRARWTADPNFEIKGQFVCFNDRRIEPCHCEDFLFRCEEKRMACKHILAALVFEQVPEILELVEDLKKRNLVAAAVSKPVTD